MVKKVFLINAILKILDKTNNLNFLYLLIYKSNHPRRFSFYTRCFLKKIVDIGSPSDDIFFDKKITAVNQNARTMIVYVGDSMAEYYSRSRSETTLSYGDAITYWLGPITRTGFTNQTIYDKTLIEIATTIKKLLAFRRHNPENILIAWSSGSIDIRCSFYELLLSKSFENEEDLFLIYEKMSEHLITNFLLPLKDAIGAKKIIMLSEIDSTIQGVTPQTLDEIKALRESSPFPVLGIASERKRWRKLSNLVTSKLATQYNLGYFDINKHMQYGSLVEQYDGVHPTNPTTIAALNSKILSEYI
jgi:hypothetical protein